MIYEVTENWTGRTAELTAEDGALYAEDISVRTYTVDFSVLPAIAATMVHYARIADDGTTKIPRLWEQHPYNSWSYVQRISANQVGPHTVEVTVEYQTLEDPVARPPEIEYLFAVTNEPVDQDRNGDAIVNSAGELFDPPITKDQHDLIIHIKRYQYSFDPVQASQFEGSVNSANFLGYAPGLVKCNVYRGKQLRLSGLWVWEVIFEFEVREDGWQKRILDQGFRTHTGTDDDTGVPLYAAIKDTSGVPLSAPTLLNGDGGLNPDTSPPVFHQFELENQYDFSVLGL